MSLICNFRYRPEIDGLRAVAVLAVVLYHAGLGVSGGFIGVDVFFVISGFLITSLIFKDLEAGKFTLTNFWERRARRIIPAAVVMVLVVLAAGWFLLLPSDYANLGKSTIWQSVFGANFYFWRSTNYFAGPADELPLLHTWSLAVEEQFYLFVPLLLAGLFCFSKLRSRRILLSLFGVGFVISLSLSIYLLPRMPAVTFYLLPTRAWELLCGSFIAILPVASLSRPLREILCWLGVAAILIPCFIYTKQTPFPGLAALPPCLGTALFIWASGTAACDIQNSKFKIQNLLATRAVVFIGLISYSLYLWHWPLFAFSHYWALEPLSLGYRLGMVVAAFILAILSWRFVETPFRVRKLGTKREAMFSYAGVGLAAVAVMGFVCMQSAGFPARFSERVYAFDQAKADALHENRICASVDLEDIKAGRIPRLGFPEPAPVELLVWGDSHARSIIPAVMKAAESNQSAILAVWHSSTAPVLDYVPPAKFAGFSLGDESDEWAEAVVQEIRKRRVPRVLLAARWSGYFEADQHTAEEGVVTPVPIGEALLRTVRILREQGTEVWILQEVPNHAVPVPKALVRAEIFDSNLKPYLCRREQLQARNAPMEGLREKLEAAGARFVDVSPLLFEESGQTYRMEMNGVALYYDEHHLTQAGAQMVAPAFAPLMGQNQADPARLKD